MSGCCHCGQPQIDRAYIENLVLKVVSDFMSPTWSGIHTFNNWVYFGSSSLIIGPTGENNQIKFLSRTDEISNPSPVETPCFIFARNTGNDASRLVEYRTGGIAGTTVSRVMADGSYVTPNGDVWGSQLRAANDTGGFASTNTLTGASSNNVTGGAATLGGVGGGPSNQAQTDWVKLYIGTNARWFPAWT